MSQRKHNVQTPGAPAATTPSNDNSQDDGAVLTPPAADPAPVETPAVAPASEATEKPRAARKAPRTREELAQTPAADIEPESLTAPVLSRDGWVMPIPKA